MTLTNLFSKLKGSSRSGNHGHAGRPGKRGGSSSMGAILTGFYSEVVGKWGTSGTEVFHAYDKSGNLIGKSQGDENAGSVLPIKGGHITIHNHPEESTFSTNDFSNQLRDRVQEMYVVTPGGKVYKSSITPKTPEYDTFKMRDLVDSVHNKISDKLLEEVNQGKLTKTQARAEIKEAVAKEIASRYSINYTTFRI